MIKSTAWRHGSREEILDELRAAITPGRSEKRKAELQAAIAALQAGAAVVFNRPTYYVVRGEAEQAVDQFIAVMNGAEPGILGNSPITEP